MCVIYDTDTYITKIDCSDNDNIKLIWNVHDQVDRIVVATPIAGFLRRDDDADQFRPAASATGEGKVCDGSGIGGDGHIRTAAAGRAHSLYR